MDALIDQSDRSKMKSTGKRLFPMNIDVDVCFGLNRPFYMYSILLVLRNTFSREKKFPAHPDTTLNKFDPGNDRFGG